MSSPDLEVEKIRTHREQAAQWLKRAQEAGAGDAEWCTAMAQVHATLALVAATREVAVNTLVG
jgi:hypothetical protein